MCRASSAWLGAAFCLRCAVLWICLPVWRSVECYGGVRAKIVVELRPGFVCLWVEAIEWLEEWSVGFIT